MVTTPIHDYGEDLYPLGLDDEMEDIELGGEVALELAMERFVRAYVAEDRPSQMHLLLLRRIHGEG